MSIEKLIADHTEALKANTTALELLQSLILASGGAATSSSDDKQAGKADTTGKSETKGVEAVTIYWCVPNTEHFGTVASEAEYKAVKKANPKAIKIPQSKYDAIVAKASKTDDEGGYSDRIQALIDAVPESPEESDIIALFTGYLPKDLSKEERDARAGILKPILEGVKAAKATAVKDEDRYDVMVAVVKGIETHLEETGQVSDEDGLV